MNKQQLASAIWEAANKMRSKIEANEYKDYILGFIFYKFLFDNEEKYLSNGDTLENDWPYFEESGPERTYNPLFVDAVVSNPPYSQNWDPADKATDARFKSYGVAPKSKADYVFLLHNLYHLRDDGKMTIVLSSSA